MNKHLALAYLAGVSVGDGYFTENTFGLHVKDFEFVNEFAKSCKSAFGVSVNVRQEGNYYRARANCKIEWISRIKLWKPSSTREMAKWLRGMFDSEGNAQLLHLKKTGPKSFSRRIAFYSTNLSTISLVAKFLSECGMDSIQCVMKRTDGHLGNKPVFEIRIRGSKANYSTFSRLVGSSITRKLLIIRSIPKSYKRDFSAHCRRIQRRGAAVRRMNTINRTLPKVISGVTELMRKGIKPTQRACRSIRGYATIQRFTPQAKLVRMAALRLSQ